MEQAAKLGARFVSTYAARGAGPGATSATRCGPSTATTVDPRAGFRQLRASESPRESAERHQISDLYKSKEGIAWWDKNGDGIKMSFDPKPGSYSMKKMASYQAERASVRPK